jgi:putative cardiolipin synthase
MTEAFYRRIGRIDSELLIEVPYFVVRDRGLAAVKSMRERGVHIRVLTNSLASNDVLAAHAGHAEKRKELIAAASSFTNCVPIRLSRRRLRLSGSSRSSLHCKAFAFDRKDVFIGSLNLDPRSGDINTEAGLYIEPGTDSSSDFIHERGGVAAKQLPGPVGRGQSPVLGHRNRREAGAIRS